MPEYTIRPVQRFKYCQPATQHFRPSLQRAEDFDFMPSTAGSSTALPDRTQALLEGLHRDRAVASRMHLHDLATTFELARPQPDPVRRVGAQF
jgi:hypothetical protein